MSEAAATVFVVDDDGSTRELMSFLMKRNGLAVEVFPDAASFVAAYRADRPGCLVLDLNMPGMSGLDLQQYLKEQGVLLPVIFLSGRADIPKAVQAVREGAVDFIEKPFDDDVMLAAVRAALTRGEKAGKRDAERAEIEERINSLSAREREVLQGLVAGHPNKIIAFNLGISPRTVEIYRANVMSKMQAPSLSDLVRMALIAEIF